nr:sulfotransferase [uncultured Methylophaga sp.]
MSKILVIDGLARSGTTLISSIIHSQKISACYRGVFHEFMATDVGKWPMAHARAALIDDYVRLDPSLLTYLRVKFAIKNFFNPKELKLSYAALRDHTIKNLTRREQFDTLSLAEWQERLDNLNPTSLSDLDELYQSLADDMNVQLLSFRWNQGLPYINKWLRNPNHHWLSVVRNPMDRALSAKKAFHWTYEESIKATKRFGDNLEQTLKAKNHHLIYFEDLIQSPKEIIDELYKSLGLALEDINFNLLQQSGRDYMIETSDLIHDGMCHTSGKKHIGFDPKMINKYRREMSANEVDIFYAALKDQKLFARYF